MTVEVITLKDEASGATARIAPGLGFNCFSFRPCPAGAPLETLWSAPEFLEGTARPSGSGIPLLFPFPGRIGARQFHFQGRDYALRSDDRRGNAIHGFVLDRPWQVVEHTTTRVVARFQASRADPQILEQWPADFCLTARYELQGQTLQSEFTVENPSDRPLPWGFGTHPYFRVPLGGLRREACRVFVPAREIWELVDMLPTGRRLPAEGRLALHQGLAFGETQFDDVFTGLSRIDGGCGATIDDPDSGRKLTLSFDANFREIVVYNPPHREAICLEPYTCVPDPFALTARGIDAGLRVLGPGESCGLRIEMALC